jgi:hypothetical protein
MWLDTEKIYPEKLFRVATIDNCIKRIYHSWIPQDEKGNLRGFPIITMTNFWRNEKEQINTFEIEQFGEVDNIYRYQEYLKLFLGRHLLNLYLISKQKDISVDYDEDGLFFDINGVFHPISELPIKASKEINQLNQSGFLKLVKDESEYNFHLKGDNIFIKRYKNNQIEDEFVLPQRINRRLIMEELFDPVTLKDPINAPPELYDSWRFANLMDIVGVKWERF